MSGLKKVVSAVLGLMALSVSGSLVAYAQFAERPVDPAWLAEKQELSNFGKQFDSAWEMYQALEEEAGGGSPLGWDEIPDVSGVWQRVGSPFFYDPDQRDITGLPPSVKLKPAYEEELRKRIADREKGILFDPISICGVPRGFPGWFVEPFLREFVITPHQTWMINEAMNEIRRIYTDGRDHIPEEAAYATANGDTIGFWDGQRLVAHTTYVKAGIIQRIQPWHSDQTEAVEIWQKVDENTLQADVWLFDPVVLEEPWFTRQKYTRLPNEDKLNRIHYWACAENPNNDITRTEEGGSDFTDFTFDEDAAEQ